MADTPARFAGRLDQKTNEKEEGGMKGNDLTFGVVLTGLTVGTLVSLAIHALLPLPADTDEEVAAVAAVVTNAVPAEIVEPEEGQITPEFVKGFEAGVQWGITSYLRNTSNRSVAFHTLEAKRLYWLVVVDEGRTLLEIAVEKRAKGK